MKKYISDTLKVIFICRKYKEKLKFYLLEFSPLRNNIEQKVKQGQKVVHKNVSYD